jgi:hypothetical protein
MIRFDNHLASIFNVSAFRKRGIEFLGEKISRRSNFHKVWQILQISQRFTKMTVHRNGISSLVSRCGSKVSDTRSDTRWSQIKYCAWSSPDLTPRNNGNDERCNWFFLPAVQLFIGRCCAFRSPRCRSIAAKFRERDVPYLRTGPGYLAGYTGRAVSVHHVSSEWPKHGISGRVRPN